jgi:RES domain-containing protein
VLPDQNLRAALNTAPLVMFDDTAYRAVDAWEPFPVLSGEGSLHHDGRYHTAGLTQVLYLAGSLRTVLFERNIFTLDERGALLVADLPPTTIVSVRARVQALLDLRNLAVQDMLQTNIVELTHPWAAADAPTETQRLGTAAFSLGHSHGLIAPSAVDPNGWNLVIFVERLQVGEAVRIVESPH